MPSPRLPKELRDKLGDQHDPIPFIVACAKGQPMEAVHPVTGKKISFVPSAKQVYDANMWIADRLIPKIKEVAVDVNVNEKLSDKIQAAQMRAQRLLTQRGKVTDAHFEEVDEPAQLQLGEAAGTAAAVSDLMEGLTDED